DHAVAENRAVAKYVDHYRYAFARRVFQAGTNAAARTQIANFAGGSVAGVIVVAAHGDGASTGITVDYQFGDRGGFAEFAIAVKFGLAEHAARADQVGIGNWINGGRIAKTIGQIGTFHI